MSFQRLNIHLVKHPWLQPSSILLLLAIFSYTIGMQAECQPAEEAKKKVIEDINNYVITFCLTIIASFVLVFVLGSILANHQGAVNLQIPPNQNFQALPNNFMLSGRDDRMSSGMEPQDCFMSFMQVTFLYARRHMLYNTNSVCARINCIRIRELKTKT